MAINSRNGNTLLESGFFPPCRAASTGAALNPAIGGILTVDGVVLAAGDRVLCKDETSALNNGIYAAGAGPWVRTSDAASNQSFFDGMAVVVAQGAVNGGTTFICTATDDPVVIGTSLLTFASQAAVAAAGSQATSTSSIAVGTGAKTFAIQTGKGFVANNWVLIWETATPANAMLAQVTSYSGASLIVNSVAAGGSGTHADWSIALTGAPATQGLTPPVGTGNVTGPGSSTSGNVPTFADATGKLLQDSGTALGTLAGRNTLLYGDAGAKSIPGSALADGAAPLPYVAAQVSDNLVLSNDATNATRDIDISPGRCRDLADTANLQLAGIMVKRLDQAWAAGGVAGSPVGSLDTGSSRQASKTYHVYLIGKLGQNVTQRSRTTNVATLTIASHGLGIGGTVRVIGVGGGYDGVFPITGVATNTLTYANTGSNEGATGVAAGIVDGFDVLSSQQDVNAYPGPVLPSGWTVKQCLGSVLTDGSTNNLAFKQLGDLFAYLTGAVDKNTNNPGGGANLTLSVPVGLSVLAHLRAGISSNNSGNPTTLRLNAVDMSGGLDYSDADLSVGQSNISGAAIQVTGSAQAWVRTSTAGQIAWGLTFSGATITITVRTLGWRDPRRRLF